MTTKKKVSDWKAAYSAWAVVGVLPDGTEHVLDVGKQQDVAASYSRMFNCPTYDSVHLRDLSKPTTQPEVRAA